MYEKKNPIIFILSGKAKSGKNEVASIIEEYFQKENCIQVAYAYYLKDYLKRMNNYNELEKDKYRSLLQEFGSEFLVKHINQNFLINRVMEDIEVFSYFYNVIIVSDARLVDEIDVPKNKLNKVITIRILSSSSNGLTEEEQNHITETGLDSYSKFDYIIENNGTREELKNKTIDILKGVR